MSANANPTGCQAKTGFVILHKCNQTADAQCGSCGKYLCRKHAHIIAGAPTCESCLKQNQPEEYKKVVGSRKRYSHYYGYRPYYYSHYGTGHHALFDRGGTGDFHEDGEGS